MSKYIHLHNHSHYSLLDGACRIPDLVDAAVESDMPALSLTDHGNMFGAIEFYKAAKQRGIKPIIGVEAYVAPRSRKDRKAPTGIADTCFTSYCWRKTLLGIKI